MAQDEDCRLVLQYLYVPAKAEPPAEPTAETQTVKETAPEATEEADEELPEETQSEDKQVISTEQGVCC